MPTVIGAVALSAMAGFALGIYKFRGNLLIFFMFIAGNFVPFQILMVPVRDLTISIGTSTTPRRVWCCSTSPSRPGSARSSCATSSAQLPFPLIEAARVEGVAEWRIFWL